MYPLLTVVTDFNSTDYAYIQLFAGLTRLLENTFSDRYCVTFSFTLPLLQYFSHKFVEGIWSALSQTSFAMQDKSGRSKAWQIGDSYDATYFSFSSFFQKRCTQTNFYELAFWFRAVLHSFITVSLFVYRKICSKHFCTTYIISLNQGYGV